MELTWTSFLKGASRYVNIIDGKYFVNKFQKHHYSNFQCPFTFRYIPQGANVMYKEELANIKSCEGMQGLLWVFYQMMVVCLASMW